MRRVIGWATVALVGLGLKACADDDGQGATTAAGATGPGGGGAVGGTTSTGGSGAAGGTTADGAWQQILESEFDVVETFDQLADWRGGTGEHHEPDQMPSKLDGTPSIWGLYTNDTEAVEDWIRDHGPDHRWGDSGKSLCINYNNFVGGIDGYGPSRLGTFVGDGVSPASGYQQIHVFFMVKFREGFFSPSATNVDEFAFVGTLKLVQLSTGFTAIDHWGTADEHALACDTAQTRNVYGLNDSVVNVAGGGLSNGPYLYLHDHCFIANDSGSCWDYTAADGGPMHDGAQGTLQDMVHAGEWIGLELAMDLGTVGQADGTTEVWLYDQTGAQVGHHRLEGQRKLAQYDHRYNKVVLGGNRFGSGYDEDEGDSDENRFYVDDFIIHGSRIAPTYFSLRADR